MLKNGESPQAGNGAGRTRRRNQLRKYCCTEKLSIEWLSSFFIIYFDLSSKKKTHHRTFVKFFLIFKLESDFFPHFLSKIRKLENCAHLFHLKYNWANFQQNRGQKNSSLSLHFHFTSLHFTYEDRCGRSR